MAPSFYSIINSGQRLLGKSRQAARAAFYLRNQCNRVLRFYVGDETDPEKNGEAWLVRNVGPHIETFVDVGANVGNWAAMVWAQQPSSRGLLLEPAESALKLLANRFGADERATIIAAAAGAQEGIAEFFEDAGAGETSSLFVGHAPSGSIRRQVRVAALDKICPEIGLASIDLLKIDAEGYDFQVLRGAETLLKQQRVAVVQFEYNRPWANAGSTLAAACDFLNQCCYRVYALRGTGLRPFEYSRFGEFFDYANFVALSPSAVEKYGSLVGAPI
ncbi:MAG: FkbM family methyltransferase [Myxococcales bacterium]